MKGFVLILLLSFCSCKSQKEILYYESANKHKIEEINSRCDLISNDLKSIGNIMKPEIEEAIKLIDITCNRMQEFITQNPEECCYIGLGRTNLIVFDTGQRLSELLNKYFKDNYDLYRFNPNLKIYHFENQNWIESFSNFYPFETILRLKLLKEDLLMYIYSNQLYSDCDDK